MDVQREGSRLTWLAGAGALLSLLACYGTLALIAILSVLGISLAINVHVWAAVIVAFALMAVLGVGLGYRHHHHVAPVLLAAGGAGLVIWAMYGSDTIRAWFGFPSQVVELPGFAGLIVAAYWDWRLKTTSRV